MTTGTKPTSQTTQYANIPSRTAHMSDFIQHPWCRTVLADPSFHHLSNGPLGLPDIAEMHAHVTNSFFTHTLCTDTAFRAWILLFRPGTPPSTSNPTPSALSHQDVPSSPPEALVIVSIGTELDGATGRLHGGVTSALLDHDMGTAVSSYFGRTSSTAELAVRYKRPVGTPCVVLCRARIESVKGRWMELKSWVEDGMGVVYAEGEGAFVVSRPAAM